MMLLGFESALICENSDDATCKLDSESTASSGVWEIALHQLIAFVVLFAIGECREAWSNTRIEHSLKTLSASIWILCLQCQKEPS
jgi:hypothetical protein